MDGVASGQRSPTLRQKDASPRPTKKAKRSFVQTPVMEVRSAIISAAKHQDPSLAVRAFDRAVAEDIPMRADSYNTLLFLCSGGDKWRERFEAFPIPWALVRAEPAKSDGQADEGEIAPTPDGQNNGLKESAVATSPLITASELFQKGKDILAHMERSDVGGLNEMSYTGLARIAAAGGDGDKALEAARAGQAAKVPARHRTFLPALLAYAEAGKVDDAFQVANEMISLGLDWSETECAALLWGCQYGSRQDQAYKVLRVLGKEMTTLSQQTIAAAKAYFSSDAANGCLPSGERWQVESCNVGSEGISSVCGGQLQTLDLEENEWSVFAEGIATLAKKERKPDSFKEFQEWLEAHGPFSIILDGANLAFYGQNFQQGGFQFSQIGDAVETVRQAFPRQKPLVLLHSRRLQAGPARAKDAAHLIRTLESEHMLFPTPVGSNDDWYWMFAAVKAGPQGLLVSNDEMRDHIFQLLAPKYFLKWKQGHQMRYKFTSEGLKLYRPPKYTVCTQHLETGSWLLPDDQAETKWLCARPIKNHTP